MLYHELRSLAYIVYVHLKDQKKILFVDPSDSITCI